MPPLRHVVPVIKARNANGITCNSVVFSLALLALGARAPGSVRVPFLRSVKTSLTGACLPGNFQCLTILSKLYYFSPFPLVEERRFKCLVQSKFHLPTSANFWCSRLTCRQFGLSNSLRCFTAGQEFQG